MTDKKNLTFETALARLDEIVSAMENGQTMLDESLSLYEEGIALIQFCSRSLDDAEQKVKLLQKGENGEFSEIDFATQEDAVK